MYQFFYSLILLGAIQGIIFSLYGILQKKNRTLSNLFLTLLILGFSYNLIQSYLWINRFITPDQYFKYFYMPFSTVYMVLFYFYVKTYLYPDEKMKKIEKFYFIPFLIFMSFSIVEKFLYASNVLHINRSELVYIIRIIQEISSVILSLFLIVKSLTIILKFENKVKKKNLKYPNIQIKWLKIITCIFFILCIYWVIPLYLDLTRSILDDVFYPYLWVGLAFTIYILGHIGLYQFGIAQEQVKIHKFSQRLTSPITEINNSLNDNIEKFENFVFLKKNFLDSNLSLEKVAEEIGVNKSYMSRLINSELETSFTDYVNKLRIEEAKIYLANPDFKNYTLLAIGLEAGFNSKSVFNAAFKKFTGMTPSEFRKSTL